MASIGIYKRILQLIEQWPVDKNKAGRDLGKYLRNYISQANQDGKFSGNEQYWDRQYLSLQRLINNEHRSKYTRGLSSTATGLTAEQCNTVLTSEFLELVEKENTSTLSKLFSAKKNIKTNITRTLCTQALCELEENIPHMPVMVQEVLEYLKPQPKQTILDMTFGAGGHSRKILESAPNIKLLTLDRDPVAYDYMSELSQEFPNQVIPLQGRFSELPDLLKSHNIRQNSIDGILYDFGCSSMQFDVGERGFSISKNGPLDMRMDGNRFPDNPTAADVLASASEEDIYKIIKVYGEEKQARKIARAVVEARYLFKQLRTTEELADLVDSVCDDEYRLDKLQRKTHNATKTFQALRIFVNNELNEINYGLILAQKYLKLGGRIVTITFHSLEDTIVKRHLLGNVLQNTANALPLKYSSHTFNINKEIMQEVMISNWKCLHKHVIVPKLEEVENNPRSRSAKLRAAVRIR